MKRKSHLLHFVFLLIPLFSFSQDSSRFSATIKTELIKTQIDFMNLEDENRYRTVGADLRLYLLKNWAIKVGVNYLQKSAHTENLQFVPPNHYDPNYQYGYSIYTATSYLSSIQSHLAIERHFKFHRFSYYTGIGIEAKSDLKYYSNVEYTEIQTFAASVQKRDYSSRGCKGIGYGLNLGAEYFLCKHLSAGMELQLSEVLLYYDFSEMNCDYTNYLVRSRVIDSGSVQFKNEMQGSSQFGKFDAVMFFDLAYHL